MPGVTCPSCGALTDTRDGTCDVCRKPLKGYAAAATLEPTTVFGAAPAPKKPEPPPSSYETAPTYSMYGPGPVPYIAGPTPGPGYAPALYYPPPAIVPAGPGYAPPSQSTRAADLAKKAAGSRWAAAIVDDLIVLPIILGLAFLYIPRLPPPWGVYLFLALVLFSFLYYGIQDGGLGRTIGKRACGLVVVDKDLKRIGLLRGFARSQELWLWVILLGIGFFLIQIGEIHKSGQSAGDQLTGSYVVLAADVSGAGKGAGSAPLNL